MNTLILSGQHAASAVSVEIDGMKVSQDASGRFCINDLHRAAGGEKRHSPSYWLTNQQTQALIRELETTGFPAVQTYAGVNGGTYVVKELVYSYAMWISSSFHLKVIRAYDKKTVAPAELSRMDILKIAMEAEQGRLLAIEQRDEALRTKAEIGSRREATAMATASAKAREVERLKSELGRNQAHATVKAVEKMLKRSFGNQGWRPLRDYCLKHGLEARNVVDEQYGTVKAWPAMAWRAAHEVDLEALFYTEGA